HLFAVSYFTGNAKITETSEEAPAAGDAGDGTTTISKGEEAGETQEVEAPPAQMPARAEAEGPKRHPGLCAGGTGQLTILAGQANPELTVSKHSV
ncbi:hypothetical protein, partial [Methyloceanibacter marginalis]|uniref:hypothetical protein n=1 Tax=Methyloceanibacter marginalis TaxID=1774971 RepID=UPI0013014149